MFNLNRHLGQDDKDAYLSRHLLGLDRILRGELIPRKKVPGFIIAYF